MEHYAGIDVSREQSSVCVVDGTGRIVREARVASEPEALVRFLRQLGLVVTRIGLEAGPVSQWLHAGLAKTGLEVVLLETRQVKAALSAMATWPSSVWSRLNATPALKVLVTIIADGDDARLPTLARQLLVLQVEHLRQVEAQIAVLDGRLVRQAREDEASRRLIEVPGIGPVIATAMVATVGDARLFATGRSWLGLTPRQHATGGKERLLGISKRGDGYLRRQLMHGARSLVQLAHGREGHFWAWIKTLLARRPFNVVVAAVANKLARTIWAMLSRGDAYRMAT